MLRFSIKLDILLVILVPLLVTFVATALFYGSQKPEVTPVESLPQRIYSDSTIAVMSVEGLEETVRHKVAPKQFMGPMQLGLALALVMSLASLFGHYYPSKALWYVNIILSLLFTIIAAGYVGIKLTAFFIPNLLLTIALTFIVTKLFYNRSLIRIRMVLCSILAAVAVALYYFMLSKITGSPAGIDDLKVWFINSVINLVFITYGLSLADLFVSQLRLKRAKTTHSMLDDDEDIREL